jgi:hypothetical protein
MKLLHFCSRKQNKMKQEETVVLIKGEFTAEQAKEILTNVFSTKIHFHQMKNFSSLERFSKEDEIAISRLPELKRELKRTLAFLETSEFAGKNIQVHSEIKISIINE